MARVIPSEMSGLTPPSHRRVVAALRELPDDWLVVYAPRWVGRARPHEPLQDGGCDVLLAHPLLGLLGLSIIDGGLMYEPSGRHWTRLDGLGQRIDLPDPFEQSRLAMGLLVGKLAEHPAAVPSRPVAAHGVVAPDILAPSQGFAAHAPSELVLDRRSMDNLAQAAKTLLERHAARHPAVGNASSRWWWRAVEDLFLMPRQARVLLRDRIAEEQAQMVALSPQQLGVLDMLARVRQQAVYGPAGTGKTLLAMHKARLLARQGMTVLLTCYNKALGHHLRATLADEPRVQAIHFHELCYEILGIDPGNQSPPTEREAARRYWDEELAQRVLAVSGRHGPSFDALVVDESQDFLPLWWRALDSLLIDPHRGIRYLFFDDAQRLRSDAAPVQGADTALVLTTNWRNTQRIHAHMCQVQPDLQVHHCVAPLGVPVEIEPIRPTLGKALRRVLGRILGDGGVQPADVVILTGQSPNRSAVLEQDADLRPYRVTTGDEPGAVRLRGVQSFKGMEAPVVILTGLDHYPPEKARLLHYIGASRAVNHLVVMGDATAALPREAV